MYQHFQIQFWHWTKWVLTKTKLFSNLSSFTCEFDCPLPLPVNPNNESSWAEIHLFCWCKARAERKCSVLHTNKHTSGSKSKQLRYFIMQVRNVLSQQAGVGRGASVCVFVFALYVWDVRAGIYRHYVSCIINVIRKGLKWPLPCKGLRPNLSATRS